MMDKAALKEGVDYIRSVYSSARIPLVSGGGLADALVEAEAYAEGREGFPLEGDEALNTAIERVHVVYSLADQLRSCLASNLDVSRHLSQLTTGTTDHGTPAPRPEAGIYFKDFEYELFIAAQLLRAGIKVSLSDPPNDPRGDLKVGPLWVEIKHPNSTGQLQKRVRKFQKVLAEGNAYGIIVVGVEDAFSLGSWSIFQSSAELHEAQAAKSAAMEEFGREFLSQVDMRDRILGTVQTQTMVECADGEACLARRGNACLFDNRMNVPRAVMEAAQGVLSVFCDPPVRYSVVARIRRSRP